VRRGRSAAMAVLIGLVLAPHAADARPIRRIFRLRMEGYVGAPAEGRREQADLTLGVDTKKQRFQVTKATLLSDDGLPADVFDRVKPYEPNFILRGPKELLARVGEAVSGTRLVISGEWIEGSRDFLLASVEADPRLRLGSESEASVWRSVRWANAVPRPAKPARQTVAQPGPWNLRLRRAAAALSSFTPPAPESLPRRLRRPRHVVRLLQRPAVSRSVPRPETQSRVDLLENAYGVALDREPHDLPAREVERIDGGGRDADEPGWAAPE